MTDAEKLTLVKTLLDDGTGYMPDDTKLNAYIMAAGQEILNWRYHLIGGIPDDVTAVPTAYEMTQVYAVIAGYTQAGAEGEKIHIENGVHRDFRYSDMLDYVHQNVLCYARVGVVSSE